MTPIYVPDSYYNFADGRHDLGIPHTGDVLSNGAFAIVAIWGLFMVYRARDRVAFKPGLAISLTTFFSAVFLVTFGSGYFHLDPGPDRIFLDRLPISLAAGAILATLLIDRWTPSQKGALLTFVGDYGFCDSRTLACNRDWRLEALCTDTGRTADLSASMRSDLEQSAAPNSRTAAVVPGTSIRWC